MNNFKFLITFLILSVLFQSISSCKKSDKLENKVIKDKIIDLPPNMKYGFNLNDFIVKKKKIKRGDTFGSILEENFIDYPEVHKILQKIKTQVSVKKLQIGKPYTLLFSKDSIKAPKIFIYQKDIQGYTIVQLRDSIYGLKKISLLEQFKWKPRVK